MVLNVSTRTHILSCVYKRRQSCLNGLWAATCVTGSFHKSDLRRLIVYLLKAVMLLPQSFCFLCHVSHQTAQTDVLSGCLNREREREEGRVTDGQRERHRAVVSLHGIKAGYIRASSDRIKDGMPDPFSARPHPR